MDCSNLNSTLTTESFLWLTVIILTGIVAVLHWSEEPYEPLPPNYGPPKYYTPDKWDKFKW